MELTVRDVARRYGCTPRAVQLAIGGGHLSALRRVGSVLVVDDLAAQAWSRSAVRGRCWSERACEAALDLLSTGSTDAVGGAERSRLVRRLRTMGARHLAHASGGLGTWARYEAPETMTVAPIGPSAVTMTDLGILGTGGWLRFGCVDDLDRFEFDADVRPSGDGNLGVVERPGQDDRLARVLLDTYLLGDARASAAAGARLEELASAL